MKIKPSYISCGYNYNQVIIRSSTKQLKIILKLPSWSHAQPRIKVQHPYNLIQRECRTRKWCSCNYNYIKKQNAVTSLNLLFTQAYRKEPDSVRENYRFFIEFLQNFKDCH